MPTMLGIGLPTPVNLEDSSQTCALRFVSMVTLNAVMLLIKVNHHSWVGGFFFFFLKDF